MLQIACDTIRIFLMGEKEVIKIWFSVRVLKRIKAYKWDSITFFSLVYIKLPRNFCINPNHFQFRNEEMLNFYLGKKKLAV